MSEPQLAPALFALSCNTPDSKVIENIKASRERGLPFVTVAPVRDRGLVIMGSGPSLLSTYADLPPDCDIMALNGAYPFLLERGIEPKYAVCLDPKPSNVNFFAATAAKTYHLLASQCDPSVYDHLRERGVETVSFYMDGHSHQAVFKTDEVTAIAAFPTVGLTALVLAAVLGYRKLHLYGYDSSFGPGNIKHSRHQTQNEGCDTVQIEFKGKWYTTTPAMAQQVSNFLFLNGMLHKNYPDMEINLRGSGMFYDFVTAAPEGGSTRESELAKYTHLYDTDHYGMSQFRANSIAMALPFNPYCRTLLDVGTGRGETLKMAKMRGYEVVMGTETVEKLLNEDVVYAALPKLPFPDKSFDVVTSFEVMEHLWPFDVETSLQEMARVARNRVIVSCATVPHIVGGVNLHPSARLDTEWHETIRRALPNAKVEYIGQASECGVSPIFEIVL